MLLVRLDQLLLRLVDKQLSKRRIMGQLEGTGTSICSKVGPPLQLILHPPLSVLLVLATTPLTCLFCLPSLLNNEPCILLNAGCGPLPWN